MPAPRVLVLRAPGTNCDRETVYAFERAGAVSRRVHVDRLLEAPKLADDYQVLCVPGGFCYGDDIAAGKILANQLRHHLGDMLCRFREQDRLILGICNGFQVLLKAGILVPDERGAPVATLAFNDSGRFEDRWVCLETEPGTDCVFLEGVDRLELPIAHAEGKLVCRDDGVLAAIANNRQIALRYTNGRGQDGCQIAGAVTHDTTAIGDTQGEGRDVGQSETLPYPVNPNGSAANIAGLCDSTGRVLGLMPHPERHLDANRHPRWTRRAPSAEGDGLALFRNAVRYFS
jgi:phosphoribosylformylglycinamidine synthase